MVEHRLAPGHRGRSLHALRRWPALVVLLATLVSGDAHSQTDATLTEPASAAEPSSGWSDPTDSSDARFSRRIERWTGTLQRISRRLQSEDVGRAEIAPLNNRLRALQESIVASRDRAASRVDAELELLDALGPPPGDNDPPEVDALASERESIRRELARYRGEQKQAELLLARLNGLFERMVEVEYRTLVALLTQQTVYPLVPDTLVDAQRQLVERISRIGDAIKQWWDGSGRVRSIPIVGLTLVLIIGLLAMRTVRRWRRRWQARPAPGMRPNRGQRFMMAIIYIGERGVVPAATLGAMAMLLHSQPIFGSQFHLKASGLLWAAARLLLMFSVVAALLAPRVPRWRSTSFTDAAAIGLYRAVRLYVFVVLALGTMVALLHPSADVGGSLSEEAIASYFSIYPELSSTSAMLILFGFTATLLHVLRPRHWRFTPEAASSSAVATEGDDPDNPPDDTSNDPVEVADRPLITAREDSDAKKGVDATESTATNASLPPSRLSRIGLTLARAALFASLFAGLLGFLNAGVYIADRTASSLGLIALALMLRNLVASALYHTSGSESEIGQRVRRRLLLDDSSATRLVFWLLLIVDCTLIIGVLVALALLWGVPLAELQLLSDLVVYGISIGDYTLSLIDLLVAVGAFVLVFAAVRLFRGVLSARILTQTRLDVGARDAVTAVVGYVGLTVAALVALTLLGIDFGRLALILGALSVGIGFGLQHVVSNFVSGLILLATRPIKSGDWIVVGQYQGYVKQINVVTTEIQTFDNAAVLVPNTSLVSTDVLNWTHKSTVGRVIVAVRAGLQTSPEAVRDVLWRCVKGNRDVLRRPAPLVLFMGFGPSALDFEIRFFIREIDNVLVVSSDLRYRIVEAFRDAGIEIPFPQQDVHVRDVRPGKGHEDLTVTGESDNDRRDGASSTAAGPRVAHGSTDRP